MHLRLLALTSMLVVAQACTWLGVDPNEPGGTGSDARPAIMNPDDDFSAWPSGLFTIENPRIVGNELHMTVGYSGCDRTAFDFIVSNAWLESFPVQADTHLSFEETDCDAAFSHPIAFDLQPVQEAYAGSYQTASGAIRLRLQDSRNQYAVLYTF